MCRYYCKGDWCRFCGTIMFFKVQGMRLCRMETIPSSGRVEYWCGMPITTWVYTGKERYPHTRCCQKCLHPKSKSSVWISEEYGLAYLNAIPLSHLRREDPEALRRRRNSLPSVVEGLPAPVRGQRRHSAPASATRPFFRNADLPINTLPSAPPASHLPPAPATARKRRCGFRARVQRIRNRVKFA